jgi:DNA-binding NarL/FixJ family response regulator
MSMKPINLAMVDEYPLFIKVLKNYLGEQKDIDVVFHTSDLPDLFEKLKHFTVDLLLIDVSISQQDVLEALTAIRNSYPKIRVLVLSKSTDISLVNDLLDLGIHGYISKMDDPEELVQAIISVAEGKIHRNKLFTEALYLNKQNNSRIYTAMDLVSLNEREKKVLQLLWEEKSNKEIADEVFLSVRSIEKIRQDMKEKLGIKSTVGLLKYAISKKIISVNPTNDMMMSGRV